MATNTDVPIEAVSLVAQLVQANCDWQTDITNCLIAGFKAERDAIHDGVRYGLNTIEEGGTTRQYEQGLWLIERALVPTYEVKDFYLRRAERWLVDGSEEPGYYRANAWEGAV